jgi:hypothetical protein
MPNCRINSFKKEPLAWLMPLPTVPFLLQGGLLRFAYRLMGLMTLHAASPMQELSAGD